MKISIIILNYNYAHYLRHAIDSALIQTHSDCEVIVVDDGSTDTSQEVIKSYKSSVKSIFKSNGGAHSAINQGFLEATGEVIIFLDADDLLSPSTAAEVERHFREKSNLSWVQYQRKYIDANGQPIDTASVPITHEQPTGNYRSLILDSQLLWCAPTSSNAFRRSTLAQLLPIPDDQVFQVSGFDTYLCNLSLLCGEVESLPFIGNYYRVHGANNFFSDQKLALSLEQLTKQLRQQKLIFERARSILRSQGCDLPKLGNENLSTTRAEITLERLDNKQFYLSYRLIAIALRGVSASLKSRRLTLRGKILSAIWFLGMLASPSILAKWLANISYQKSFLYALKEI